SSERGTPAPAPSFRTARATRPGFSPKGTRRVHDRLATAIPLRSSGLTLSSCGWPPDRFCSGDREESAMKKYLVTLTADEREQLPALITAGKAAAKKIAHARILLKADQSEGGPAWADEKIAEAVEVSTDTVARVRQRFVEQGLEAALVRKKQDKPSRERVLDGAAEARLIAVPCPQPPHQPN